MQPWKKQIEERLRGLGLSPVREAEILEELAQHLDDRYRELMAAGLDPADAYARVVAELDGSLGRDLRRIERRVDQETVIVGTRGNNTMKDLFQDLKYALRVLRKNPGFTAVAVLSLALGIGANTAIFQLFDAVFLRTLPVKAPEQLAEVRIPPTSPGRAGKVHGARPELTYAQWEQIRDRQQVFSDVFAWGGETFNLARGGEARYARGLWVSGDFFRVLGVTPALGRVLGPADDRKGAGSQLAVISYAFWKSGFGGDPGVIGKTISIDGHSFDIVGVSQAGFTGLQVGTSFDVALPINAAPVMDGVSNGGNKAGSNRIDARWWWWLDVMGRLKPGVSVDQASAQLAAMSPELFRATLPNYTPDEERNYLSFKLAAYPAAAGVSGLRQTYESPLYLLIAIAGVVLIIACANLANLLLARASSRQKEIAIRLAIGASRGRLARQLLSESMMLALLGAAAGAVIGNALARLLVSFLSTANSPVFVNLEPDWRVIGFLGGLALLTCLLFGLMPAIRGSNSSPASVMRSSSRGLTADRAHFGLRRALVVVQVALSLVMLVGAFLFSGSLRRLLTIDAGFRQEGILAADLDFSGINLPKERRLQFPRELLDRIRAVPGVDSAANVDIVPLTGFGWNNMIERVGDPQHIKLESNFNRVSPGFFKTMAIPILTGRDIAVSDTANSPVVAVINEVVAKKLFGGANPLGKTLRVDMSPGEPERIYQVVGLVRATKYNDIHQEDQPIVYLADLQAADPGEEIQVVIHSDISLPGLVSAIKQAVGDVNPAIVEDFWAMRTSTLNSLLRERLLANLSGFFGILAVLLACIGLYGVMSYGVTMRTGEIGVRMALGAARRDVVWLVLKEALVLVGLGMAIGLPAVAASVRFVSSLLFGANPADPWLIALGAITLTAVAVLAAFIPARRASRTEPMNALRSE